MIKIDPDFWSKVEDSSNLNYVVYGDSIAEDEKVLVGLKSNNYEIENLSFKNIWNKLSYLKSFEHKNNKEYIFIHDEIVIYSYFNRNDELKLVYPKYIMRHNINSYICELFIMNDKSLKLTNDHSLLVYDESLNELNPISVNNATDIITINNNESSNISNKLNIKSLPITFRMDVRYNGYVYDFCVPETQNFIVNGYVVHNTDSLYVNVPSIKYDDAKDANNQVTKISSEINGIINSILEDEILPKFGVDKEYNKTDFKIESVISTALFLDIKKNYAYKEIAKKGKIYDNPVVEYTGIPVIRSDYSKLSQDFIRALIEDIAFNDSIIDKPKALVELAGKKHSEIKQCIDDLNLKYIATPGKWKSKYKNEPFTVIGMRLYNTIMDTEVFRPGTDGMSVPIGFKDIHKFLEKIKDNRNRSDLFLNNVNIDKINYITVPSNFEPEILKSKFEEFLIYIDVQELWDKSYSKITKDIVNVIKADAK